MVSFGTLVVSRVIWASLSSKRKFYEASHANSKRGLFLSPLTCTHVAWDAPVNMFNLCCDRITVSVVVDSVEGGACIILELSKKHFPTNLIFS